MVWSACLGQNFVICRLSLADVAAITSAVICGVTAADGIAAAVVCGVTAANGDGIAAAAVVCEVGLAVA